jgi:hypothetical protein
MRPPPVFHDFTCANSRPRAYFKTSLTVGGNGKEYFGYGKYLQILEALVYIDASDFDVQYPWSSSFLIELKMSLVFKMICVYKYSFILLGNKKRISKKLAAQQACTDLFQLTYPEDPDIEREIQRCGSLILIPAA